MKTRALLLAPVLLAACQAGGSTSEQRSVRYLVAQGHYKQALTQSRQAWQADPDDEQSAGDYRHATVAFLLERGRQATFAGEDESALADFEHAVGLEPEAVQAYMWRDKTRRKLSDRWFQIAREEHTSDRMMPAAAAYDMALDYDRDNMDALEGLYRVGVQLGHREGLAHDYYNEGLAALRDRSLHVAGSRFRYADKYEEDSPKPARRVREVDLKLSVEFAERGLGFEEDGYYAAAKAEFKVALVLDEANEVAREGHARMAIEAEVHELYKRGDMWILRGEFDQAIDVLEEGRKLTKVQVERFDQLLGTIDDLRVEATYKRGLNLEYDFRYVDAAVVYGELLEQVGFYEDARARLDRIEQVIAEVEQIYAGLDALTDPAALAKALQRIEVLWPEYRDVQQRLDALAD